MHKSFVKLVILLLMVVNASEVLGEAIYDTVILNGKVVDPKQRIVETLNVGIQEGKVAYLGTQGIKGTVTIDASEQYVVPGFIDLHSHAMSPMGQYYQAFDGVTTALELEAGIYPISALSSQFEDKAAINFGASVSHLAARQRVMANTVQPHFTDVPKALDDSTAFQPKDAFHKKASEEQIAQIVALMSQGLDEGGLGIGLLIDYLAPALSEEELAAVFALAGKRNVPVFVHMRRGMPGDLSGLDEVLSLAEAFNAPLHVCHLPASTMGGVNEALARIHSANQRGQRVTTEAYPYHAGSTSIGAAVFKRDWRAIFDIDYHDVQWVATGERLDERSFAHYQSQQPNGQVIHHYGKSEWTGAAINNPSVVVASDAMPLSNDTQYVHPRGIGTFLRVVSHYTDIFDAEGELSLLDAVTKMTLLPAKILQNMAPNFGNKGHLGIGADADIAIIDPESVKDRATYLAPMQTSRGVSWLLVKGQPVIANRIFQEVLRPGRIVVAQ